MSNPAAGFGIADRLGSEVDGTGRRQLGTEAFRQQVLPEAENALAELLQALQFGRGFAALGTFPAWHGRFFLRQGNRHRGTCHNCTFLPVVNETLRTLERKDGCVVALHLGSKYYNYFRSNFKSQLFLPSLRAVDQARYRCLSLLALLLTASTHLPDHEQPLAL